jgi:hypothetical protein
MERSDPGKSDERAYRDYVEGIDRALAPLRVVGRLGFLPQGAENCVDVFEVIDVVNHFLDDAEALRHQLDVALEIGASPKPKGADAHRAGGGGDGHRSGANGSADAKPAEGRNEKPKGENKAKPE